MNRTGRLSKSYTTISERDREETEKENEEKENEETEKETEKENGNRKRPKRKGEGKHDDNLVSKSVKKPSNENFEQDYLIILD